MMCEARDVLAGRKERGVNGAMKKWVGGGRSQPLAEVLSYLHVQVSPISC